MELPKETSYTGARTPTQAHVAPEVLPEPTSTVPSPGAERQGQRTSHTPSQTNQEEREGHDELLDTSLTSTSSNLSDLRI